MISVSVLNGDLAHLADTAAAVERSGAELLHYDVMDGCFVDNLSFGLPVLESLRAVTAMPIDVHLMIQRPQQYIERFAKAGADLISFHVESDCDPAEAIRMIHGCGLHAGIAVSPETPVEAVYPYLDLLHAEDFVLIMTVRPGLGGQSFLPETLPKIEQLRAYLNARDQVLHIEVDGGVQAETGACCRKAGADMLVSGSYLLRAADMAAAVQTLR